jgi:hypothetical protein
MDDRKFWDSVWYIAETPMTPGVDQCKPVDEFIAAARELMKWRAADLRKRGTVRESPYNVRGDRRKV